MEAGIEAMISQFDANKDGKVQKEEWLEFFGKVFDMTIEQSMAEWAHLHM